MTDTTLKPCIIPCGHCGCDKVSIQYIRDGRSIGCHKCGVNIDLPHGKHDDLDERLINAWNTRAAPKVKQLVWGDGSERIYSKDYEIFTGHTNGKFRVIINIRNSNERFELIGTFDTIEAAKDAAQSHYEQTILSALEI